MKDSVQVPQELQESSIEKHDRFNFEVKLNYPIKKEDATNNYEIDAYFFIPGALQINARTYSHTEFFTDINNYIRFKSPLMALTGILNQKNPLSPLFKIHSELDNVKNGNLDEKVFKHIKYELRVLGCIIKSTLRDQCEFYITNLEDLQTNPDIQITFQTFLTQIASLSSEMRQLRQEISFVQVPPAIRDAFVFVDKYISLQIIERLNQFICGLSKFSQVDSIIITKLERLLTDEQQKSTEVDHMFKLELESPKQNEKYSYWEGLLKKYIQKVLYLERKPADEKSKFLQFFYSIAAGLAMFISLGLAYIFDKNFTINGFIYFAVLILAYMAKDRIKEWIKGASNRFVERNFPDNKYEIWEPHHNKTIGSSKETMRFIDWSRIPLEILNIHHAGAKSALELEGPKEDVFKYSKEVEIYTEEILDYHERHGDINDITRFNIRHLLQYADDPQQHFENWNMDKKEIEKLVADQVYHLNVIFQIKAYSKKKKKVKIFYKRLRVVLDQRGIKRVVEKKIKSF